MNLKRISAISLSYRNYASLDEKLTEACRWVTLAARQGSDLAVLPETLNIFCGDGPGNPRAKPLAEWALTDWQASCRTLLDCAVEHRIAVVIPVIVREGDVRLNCFYVVSCQGHVLGRYVKTYPTEGELAQGISPGDLDQALIAWEGLKLGGAICFDMNFPELFVRQKEAGADLFICPSLFHGGRQVNHYALRLGRPVVIAYPAWSRIIDSLGHEIAQGGYRSESLRFGFGIPVYTADINFDRMNFHFDQNQDKIEALARYYGSDIAMTLSQDDLVMAIESRSPHLTMADVADRFKLIPLDVFFKTYAGSVDSYRPKPTTKGG